MKKEKLIVHSYVKGDCFFNHTCYAEKPFEKLDTGSTGAFGELIVCSDLMLDGYEVFRAESPSTSCDLIAMKNGICFRVEVKTSSSGLFTGDYDESKYDILAMVVSGKKVRYNPPLTALRQMDKNLSKTPSE